MKKYIITAPMALAFSIGAWAADTTKEQREQMAQAHEKMATCLRSDASVQDCHKQMGEQCHDMKAGGGCMMGKMESMGDHKKHDSK